MSGAAAALQAAALARVGGLVGVSGAYEGPPLQAVYPYAIIEAGPETDWGHKSGAGSEVRLSVVMRDAGEKAHRLQALLAAARTALEPPLDVAGWQVVTLAWVRTATAREAKPANGADTVWAGAVELRARLLRTG